MGEIVDRISRGEDIAFQRLVGVAIGGIAGVIEDEFLLHLIEHALADIFTHWHHS